MATWAEAAKSNLFYRMGPYAGTIMGGLGATMVGTATAPGNWPRLGGALLKTGGAIYQHPAMFAAGVTAATVGIGYGAARLTASRPSGASKAEGAIVGGIMGSTAGIIGGGMLGARWGYKSGAYGMLAGAGVGMGLGAFGGYKLGGVFGESFRNRGVGYYLPMAGAATAVGGGTYMGARGLGWKGAVMGGAYAVPGAAAAMLGLYGNNTLSSNRRRV